MQVTLLVERLEPARGGAEAFVAAWATWLAGQGVTVAVATLLPFRESSWPARPAAVRVVSLERPYGDAVDCAARLQALGRDQGGVLHDFGAGLGGDLCQPLFGVRAAAQAAERRSLDWQGAWRYWKRRGRRAELRRLEAAQIAAGGLWIVCSQRMQADLQAAYDLPAERFRMVRNAIDSRRFAPATPAQRAAARCALGLPTDATIFLQVGHNFRLKGVPGAIRALARLRGQQPPVHLLVVGRGPGRRAFRRLAKRHGVAGRLHLPGVLADVRPVFQAADAMVHAAHYDAGSLVSLEAMAAGLPLAISVADGSAELVTDGVQGWLIRDPADPGEIAFQMKRLLDPGLRAAMGAQARVLALHNERRDAFRSLLAILEEVAARRP